MTTTRCAALTAAVLLVAAGCGGGAKPQAATAAKPAKPSGAQVLQRYIAAMRPRQKRLVSLSHAVVGAVDGVDERKPDATWGLAAKRLAASSGEFGSIATAISAVKAPVPLRHVHERLAEAVSAFGTYVFQVQTALQTGIPSLLAATAAADTSAIEKARSDWALSVARDAARLGVPIPVWLVPSPPA